MTDPRPVSEADPGGMLAAVAGMGAQLEAGYRAGLGAADLPAADGVHSIVVCGMGGSGVPGDAVNALLAERLGVPIHATKGYRLPEFAHTDTLVFAVSYSGNTEEVVTTYRDAVTRGCRVVVVTSGGELVMHAAEDGVAVVSVPAGLPAPRAAIGALTGALLGVLEATGLGPAMAQDVADAARTLEAGAARGGPAADAAANPARELAGRIGDRTPLIWGSEGIAWAAAQRWKTEINENAKRPAFWTFFPELDHNEIEGWSTGTGTGYVVISLRSPSEHPTVGPRIEATLAAVADAGLAHEAVHADGVLPLAHLFSLIQTAGFVSCYLGIAAGVDPTPIERIQAMKQRLKELG
jgi:glucose/mannose-6-phosphate isomerase